MDSSVEVPVMLNLENIAYEDIAKLNPFYEEYNNFWNISPEPEEAFSSGPSSKSSSSGSLYSSPDSFSSFNPSFNRSSSPPLNLSHQFSGFDMPESLEGAIHVVNQYQPVYETCEGFDRSQFASFDYDGDYHQRYSYAGAVARMSRSDLIDIGALDGCSQPKGLPRKQLFGENGWLGKAPEAKEAPVLNKRKSQIFKGFGKKIKQHVEDIAGDVARSHPFTHGPNSSKIVGKAAVPVTLDPVAQAKLYSEMEAMICLSANHFLVQQYREGRLSPESIKKVTNNWLSKKRLQVAEFQFDQSTQRRLILSNLRTMDFHGESSTNPVLLNSNLRNWKIITKEMSGRTFCLPDSVIRKHINEIHRILDMLGAPLPTIFAFKELQMDTLSQMQEGMVKNQRHSGGSSGVPSVRSIGHIAVADRVGW